MNSFMWKNQDSYYGYGIIINTMPPVVSPEQNVEIIEIIGRDGNFTIDYGTKKSYTLPMVCTLMDFTRVQEIKEWLQGSGDLVFNFEEYKYDARLVNQIDISQSLTSLGEFPLIWRVQPYKSSVIDKLFTFTSAGTIRNPTGNTSLPIIKIYGSGTVVLTVNSKVITLTNIVEYVTINSQLMDCYKDSALKNLNMSGEFPIFEPDNNVISWTGSVTKLEINPNWKWL